MEITGVFVKSTVIEDVSLLYTADSQVCRADTRTEIWNVVSTESIITLQYNWIKKGKDLIISKLQLTMSLFMVNAIWSALVWHLKWILLYFWPSCCNLCLCSFWSWRPDTQIKPNLSQEGRPGGPQWKDPGTDPGNVWVLLPRNSCVMLKLAPKQSRYECMHVTLPHPENAGGTFGSVWFFLIFY